MCGGPSAAQNAAAASQSELDKQLAAESKTGFAATTPFYENLITNPGQDPALASQYGVARAGQKANMAGYGDALPSGFAAASDRDLTESYAKANDANMFQRQMAGASGLNPIGAASAATSGNQAIGQLAPPNNFWENMVGGALGAAGGLFGL